MRRDPTDERLRRANPFSSSRVAGLELEPTERSFLDEVVQDRGTGNDNHDPRPRRHPRFGWRPAAALTLMAIAGATAFVLLINASSSQPSQAYGADVVRFAESTPLLLLEGPDWRVAHVTENRPAPGTPLEGRMEFLTGSPASLHAHLSRKDAKRHILPAAVRRKRQSIVDLSWRSRMQFKLAWNHHRVGTSFYNPYLKERNTLYEQGRAFKTTIPSLDATAYIAPRAENSTNQSGPGNHFMVAIWTEGENLLELSGWVPGLRAFEERLGLLAKVDSQTWLDAMPSGVVKAAEYGTTVKQMLAEIPLPPGFDQSKVPNLGLTTERYQVGAAVGGAVACAWFRRWQQARTGHDEVTAREAEKVMRESNTQWPIFREMRKEGAYPAVVAEYAAAMPRGNWYGRPLLPEVEQGLGCE